MDDRTKTAFEFAKEATTQILTLATAILAFTVTFFKDFAQVPSVFQKLLLSASWIFFLASACCGIWTLLALTGTLNSAEPKISLSSLNIRVPSGLQIGGFLAGLLLTVVFGITVLFAFKPTAAKGECHCPLRHCQERQTAPGMCPGVGSQECR